MIRIATKNDLNAIENIERICFSSPWSHQMLLSSIENGCIMVVAEQSNKVVGYAGDYPSGDITNVAVLPECRGNGYGKKLVEALQKEAKTQGIQSLFLEVRVSNAIAIALYEKCGFKRINIRKKYYSDGEDALIYAFGGV